MLNYGSAFSGSCSLQQNDKRKGKEMMRKAYGPVIKQVDQKYGICSVCKRSVKNINRCDSCKLLFCVQCWNPSKEALDLCNDCWNDLNHLHDYEQWRMLEEKVND